MKIVHTADWHIGKKLHKTELSEDFGLFINWLGEFINSEKVDILLISGDVFDLANPSSEARKQYYRALLSLRKLDCKIIITGGNHDSPDMLNAPKEILQELDITVIGGLPENIEETIIKVTSKEGTEDLIVVALPFLRDADLRSANEGYTYEDRIETIRKGIENTFLSASELCKTKHTGIPTIAMGHLYTAGIETSESERDIQIGNQATFEASRFGDYFKYIALGHIHKPQRVNGLVPIFYSGSPLPLSFSERKDEKRILLLDTKLGWEPTSVPVPVFRKLLKISGNIQQLKDKLDGLDQHTQLNSLIEVELVDDTYDAVKIYELDQLVNNFEKDGFEIVKHRANFIKNEKNASALFQKSQKLEDLKPKEVFIRRIDDHDYDTETKNEIIEAFDEILMSAHSSENFSG